MIGILRRANRIRRRLQPRQLGAYYDSVAAYEKLIAELLREHPRDQAFALAVGSLTVESFREQGDGHVAVLRAHGLTDGMAVFDLGCGCGRTAQALQRSGWHGSYTGTDIVGSFIDELKARCPTYTGLVHRELNLPAADASLDLVFHWSVFTHISPEECYLYMADSFRAMKPGAQLVFSFLELADPEHQGLFFRRANLLAKGGSSRVLDVFLHRDWIDLWAATIGFTKPAYTDGADGSRHGAFWQALVAMAKPVAAA